MTRRPQASGAASRSAPNTPFMAVVSYRRSASFSSTGSKATASGRARYDLPYTNRPSGFPARSAVSSKRAAVTGSVVPGNVIVTKHSVSEVIVEPSAMPRPRAFAVSGKRHPLFVLAGVREIGELFDQSIDPQKSGVDRDPGRRPSLLRIGHDKTAGPDFLGRLRDREIPPETRGF